MAINLEKNVNLAKYTTFQIGGNADLFCRAKNKEELLEVLEFARKEDINFIVLGGGSNLLIGDKGFRGLVILNRAGDFVIKDERVEAESGCNLSKIARATIDRGYKGLDFAASIPGTIAGAIVGNAGAYGRDVSKSLISASVWENGKLKTFMNEDFMFVYRGSRLKNEFSKKVIIDAKFMLEKGDIDLMKEALNKDATKRINDYSGANAGSYFCNLNEKDLTNEQREKLSKFIVHGKVAVGKIIDELGLKGLKVGNAIVSENHANVILNLGGAKASDVLFLERTIVDKVLSAYGIILRPEIVKIGEF